ncbi:hypothetical protein EON82_19150 [bacterium]|nr:MAG: hypothetical protein EON82_19150 [bacterium]
MILPLLSEDVVWYGPATATFLVQFAGDPFDGAKSDVRVRFIGDRSQREERIAYFDPILGAWKATLYAKAGGSYRAVLIRNGKEASVEPTEGILDLDRADNVGIVLAMPGRPDRLCMDTGVPWVGLGADLGTSPTADKVDELAKAGANWVRVTTPAEPWADDSFGAVMDAIAKRGLGYTLVVPKDVSSAWRRYALARFAASPRLIGWEGDPKLSDSWSRPTEPMADPWDGLFENRPGPFVVERSDLSRLKALRAVLKASEWADWQSPRRWRGEKAKGVVESDRLILAAIPGAKLTGVPLADGDYDLTTVDPATGASTVGRTRVEHATLDLAVPAERFFVLRRRL